MRKIQKMMGHRKMFFANTGALLLILAFLLMLVPVLLLGRYARGAADDYCYGISTYHALQTGGNFFAAIWHTVSGYYQSWQGSFAAVGLMTLAPCIWGEECYGLTAVVMLCSLIGGTVKLADTLVRRIGKGSWRDVVYLAVPMLICSIQFVPSPLNSFYWWNGAVYYTFFYGISLLYLERFLALLYLEKRPPLAAVLVPGVICGVLVGGGNYVSALLSALLGGLFWLSALWRKKERVPALLLLCAEAIPFFLSMAAPGNQVRQATVSSASPIYAVLASVAQAVLNLLDWPNWIILLMLLAWVPVLWNLCGRSRFSFRLPGLFVLLAFLLFAAQNAPHFYAVSNAGPLRLRNIVYFSSYWFYLLCEWYCIGWFKRKIAAGLVHIPKRKPWMVPTAAGVFLILSVYWVSFYAPTAFTAGCLRELDSGMAAEYAAEWDQRLSVLTDPAITDAVLEPIHTRPSLLYQQDITEDPSDWKNNVMALYWGKDSVVIREENGKDWTAIAK